MKKNKVLLVIPFLLYVGVLYYVMLPPLNWHAAEFWQFLVFTVVPVLVITIMYTFTKGQVQSMKNSKWFRRMQQATQEAPYENVTITRQQQLYSKVCKLSILLIAVIILFPTVMSFVTSRIFNAKEYSQRIDVQDVSFSEIPDVDFTKTPIIDRDSSERLGDKVMGNMTEWVSQFDVSNEYTQISYKDSVYRVTPLTYNGVIKYIKNMNNGIPAYITIDSTSGKTELVKLKDLGLEGMKYVPSAYLNKNLMRHLRFAYPTEIFGSPSFEIDEEGRPWYICSTYTYKGVGNKKSVTGAIFLDPITGETSKYDAGEIPTWADRIFPESMLIEELDDNGSLKDGYWNSKFGQNGVTVTSEGYNYLEKDGDIWLYSGITSANSDQSNLGFVLVNMRTHEAMKIATAGANETSAMESAQSEVKNYGYTATFPLLINVKNNPVYLMSLKDNGLIKMYAMVSAVDYQKVATVSSDESMDTLLKGMLNVLGSSGEDISEDSLTTKDIKVKSISILNVEGTSVYYIQSEEDELFKVSFAIKFEDRLAFLKAGDTLSISYIETDGIQTIRELK